MSKHHHNFTANLTIFFSNVGKNWKHSGIEICQMLEDHLLEMT